MFGLGGGEHASGPVVNLVVAAGLLTGLTRGGQCLVGFTCEVEPGAGERFEAALARVETAELGTLRSPSRPIPRWRGWMTPTTFSSDSITHEGCTPRATHGTRPTRAANAAGVSARSAASS